MKTLPVVLLVPLLLILACNPDNRENYIPVNDFFRNPDKTIFKISPDGQYISYLQPYQNRLNIYVQKLNTNEITRITSDTARNIFIYFWANNNQLIYFQDKGGDEYYHLYTVNKDGTGLKDLTPFEKVKLRFIDELRNSEDELLIGLNKRRPDVFDVYKLNILTGKLTLLAENPGNIVNWETDHDDKLRLAISSDGVNQSLLYRDREDQPFKVILTTNFKESIIPLRFTADNQYIYASSNIGRDKRALVKLDPRTGKEVETLFSHKDVDVAIMYYSRKKGIPICCEYITWKRQLSFFDKEAEEIFNKLHKEIPGYEITLLGADREETKLLLRSYGDKSIGAYYLYDRNTQKLVKLSDISPWLEEKKMADMKPVTYHTRDGFLIHGYLTLPKDAKPSNLPVVVYVHPERTRDIWGYKPEVQFLANRGYAVLQMNYRGSSGYGKSFRAAGFKELGRKMQNDITDGVKWLIDSGIADSGRIAIYGYSFGGYAALAGATFTPDLYACAISNSGISNLFTYIKDIPPYLKPNLQQTYETIGNPEKDADYLRAVSPVFHTDNIKIPLLIAQGAADPKVNINETNQFVKQLKKRGLEVTYIVKENEGHGYSNEENRLEFYTEMEKFLARNLQQK